MNNANKDNKDIADLIGDIKKSYHKSNLSEISTEQLSQTEMPKRIGYMLKDSTNLSNKDFSMNFDPVEAYILKKFVSEDTVNKRIVMRAEEYFKGIIFLDYFTHIITKNTAFIDELDEIAKEFERINPLLDPDIDIVAKYAGISYLSMMGKEYIMNRMNSEGAERRFNTNNRKFDEKYLGVARLDPFHESLGQKIYAMVNDAEVRTHGAGFQGLNDLRAVIFIDCLMPYIENEKSRKDIFGLMESKDYYQASMKAIGMFSREASLKSMEEYMKNVAQKSRELDMNTI